MSTREQEFHERDDEAGVEIIPMPASDGMVDVQIATAKRFPRSIARFRKEAEALALLDEETAGECIYALPRSGKVIEGPSARFAEVLMFAWGNARAEAEVIDEGQTHISARGSFFDMERNVAVRKTIKRRITDSKGRRYNEDMIGVTGNAANSIAMRNAVFAGIPKALWKPIYERARLASLGQGGTLTQKRQQLVEWFGKMAVTPEQVCSLVGVEGIEDVKEDQLITLRGFANAIKDGEIKVEDLLNSRDTGAAAATATGDLRERVRQRANGGTKKEEPKADAATEDKKLAAKRELFQAALKDKRPDLVESEFDLRFWLETVIGEGAAVDALTSEQLTKAIGAIERGEGPAASEPGSDG